MNSVKGNGNRLSILLMAILISAIVGIIIVVIIFYSFFAINNDRKGDDEVISYSYEVNEDRVNILLKHLDLMLDPKSNNAANNYILYKDLTDDQKIKIVIEDLILTNSVSLDDNKKMNITLDEVLARALAIFNVKTYDYYPDFVDFKNYHFEKTNGSYVGERTMSDEEYGSYEYEASMFSIGNYELYVQAKVGYFKDNKGCYENYSKAYHYCDGKDCIGTVDYASIGYREIHATYKIVNNQFIFSSLTVSLVDTQ